MLVGEASAGEEYFSPIGVEPLHGSKLVIVTAALPPPTARPMRRSVLPPS